MSTKKLTQAEFINRLKINFPDEKYEILDEYKNAHYYINILTKYGICKVEPWTLLKGNFPSIRTALNKTKYFINQYKERWDKYDLSNFKYNGSQVKSDACCSKHGLFKITPNNLLMGHGCNKCSSEDRANRKRMSLKEFINKSELVHGNKYNYSNVQFKNNKDKIDIICKIHSSFKQTLSDHLSGHGCKLCANDKNSKLKTIIPKHLKHHVTKVRNCISTSFRRRGFKKSSTLYNILGIDWKGFVEHLENNKYGFKVTDENIDLDHIIPISTALTINDLNNLNHYSNFQLLPSCYNKWVKRHNKFDIEHFEKWLIEKYGEPILK